MMRRFEVTFFYCSPSFHVNVHFCCHEPSLFIIVIIYWLLTISQCHLINFHRKRKRRPWRKEVHHFISKGWIAIPRRTYWTLPSSGQVCHSYGSREFIIAILSFIQSPTHWWCLTMRIYFLFQYHRVPPSTLPLSSSTSVPRSSNLPAMPPVTTRRHVSFPVTLPSLWRTMRNWINCSVVSPLLLEVCCPTSMLCFCPRRLPANPCQARVRITKYRSPIQTGLSYWSLLFTASLPVFDQ